MISLERVLFALFSVGSIVSAIGVVVIRDPIKGAMSLIACFFTIACLYLLQSAELIAVLEVLVYAGAIMVLFVFVIMLVQHHDEPIVPKGILHRIQVPAKVIAVAVVTANMLVVLWRSRARLEEGILLPEGFGSPESIGSAFMQDFLFQFELSSVLLLVAIVGAVSLTLERTKKGGVK